MELVGYLASLLVGIALGLVGGGGSILMVPILVFLFDVPPVDATSYSLFVVGVTSFIGAFPKIRQNLVSFRTAMVFGIPSLVAVFLTRKYLVPAIPEVVWQSGDLVIQRSFLLMMLFGIIMLASSISMIKKSDCIDCDENEPQNFNYPLILLEGVLVGVLTGLIGAGGGFIIIPALVTLSKLPMKMAVGTSLIIIAVKSLIGFGGDLHAGVIQIDYQLLIFITLLAVVGIFIGNGISKRVDGEKLKIGFGWMVLVMGVSVLIVELLKL